MSAVRVLPLAAIRAEADIQPRFAMSASFIEEYAEAMAAGASFPPVVVFEDGDGNLWLADGFHRFNAHKVLGLVEIACDVRAGARRDAIEHSVGANATHGLRRTNLDKRRAVETLLALWTAEERTFTTREIADSCGVSHQTVWRVQNPQAVTKLQPTFAVSGADAMFDTARNGSAAIPPASSTWAPSAAELLARTTVGDLVAAGIEVPPFEGPSAESRAFTDVVLLSHVTRFDPAALAAGLTPRDAEINGPTLRRFGEWMLAVADALTALPRLRLLEGRADGREP